MAIADYSGGSLRPEQEEVVTAMPPEPFWSENMLFTPYDPATGIGMWLHLGTVPNEWEMWEDRVILTLPGDEGVLSMWAYHRTPSEQRPGGSNLFFRCIEPFRRWTVRFDGFAQHVSNAGMAQGLERSVGRRRRLLIELDIDHVTPAWNVAAAAHGARGRGAMESQGWAKEHYEQLYRATGRVRVDDTDYRYDGIGWRDHSRGPRGGGGGAPWGGHSTSGSVWPSGRAVIFTRLWSTDGAITLEGAQITEADGTSYEAEVIEAPRLTDLVLRGERVEARLRSPRGDHQLAMTCETSMYLSMQNQIAVGVDLSGPGLMYVINFGAVEWDGETGHFYLERSDPLSLPPIVLR